MSWLLALILCCRLEVQFDRYETSGLCPNSMLTSSLAWIGYKMLIQKSILLQKLVPYLLVNVFWVNLQNNNLQCSCAAWRGCCTLVVLTSRQHGLGSWGRYKLPPLTKWGGSWRRHVNRGNLHMTLNSWVTSIRMCLLNLGFHLPGLMTTRSNWSMSRSPHLSHVSIGYLRWNRQRFASKCSSCWIRVGLGQVLVHMATLSSLWGKRRVSLGCA